MKALVRHLVTNHLEEITSKSLINCHVKGLHSIMLIDTPEHRVRLFVTTPDHVLWKNGIVGRDQKSLGIHPHHSNVTIEQVYGEMWNLNYGEKAGNKDGSLLPYKYSSQISNGKGGFVPLDAVSMPQIGIESRTVFEEGGSIYLPAHQMHTVFVPAMTVSAWFVYEGLEDPNYKPITYSNAPLDTMDFSELYQPMTTIRVLQLLKSINI